MTCIMSRACLCCIKSSQYRKTTKGNWLPALLLKKLFLQSISLNCPSTFSLLSYFELCEISPEASSIFHEFTGTMQNEFKLKKGWLKPLYILHCAALLTIKDFPFSSWDDESSMWRKSSHLWGGGTDFGVGCLFYWWCDSRLLLIYFYFCVLCAISAWT